MELPRRSQEGDGEEEEHKTVLERVNIRYRAEFVRNHI